MKVILTKVSRNQNAMRTPGCEGDCDELPAVGKPFTLLAPGLEFGIRVITTSTVVSLTDDGFQTENSTYTLKRL